MEPDLRPKCPKCGERARVVIVERARVRCVLEADGTPGRMLSTSRGASPVLGYECGGTCGPWTKAAD